VGDEWPDPGFGRCPIAFAVFLERPEAVETLLGKRAAIEAMLEGVEIGEYYVWQVSQIYDRVLPVLISRMTAPQTGQGLSGR